MQGLRFNRPQMAVLAFFGAMMVLIVVTTTIHAIADVAKAVLAPRGASSQPAASPMMPFFPTSQESPLKGVWIHDSYPVGTLEFYREDGVDKLDDKTVVHEQYDYSVQGDLLVLKQNGTTKYVYQWNIDGETLVLVAIGTSNRIVLRRQH